MTLQRIGPDWKGTFIRFTNERQRHTQSKTKIWDTLNDAGVFLGFIKWHAQWRRYCYFPQHDVALEQVCMREIAAFVEERTEEHNRQQTQH